MYKYQLTIRIESKEKLSLIDASKDLIKKRPKLKLSVKEILYVMLMNSERSKMIEIIRWEVLKDV